MPLKKILPWILITFFYMPINIMAEQNKILLKCDRISEDKDEATVEIDFKNKKITFDSLDERAGWDDFVKFMRTINPKVSTYKPLLYNITEITDSEIVGIEDGFAFHGKIGVNRNSLIITAYIYRKDTPGGPVASSYRCQKSKQAF